MDNDSERVSIGGPVEREGDELVLLIPLDEGGRALAQSARGIGEIRGDDLRVVVPSFIAEKLGIREGSHVIVDNLEGKFRIQPGD